MARDVLSSDPEITVVGAAADPYEARDQMARFSPDVLTLDLEMPRMDGLTFLALLMESRPIPVVVMSSLTQRGSEFALEALRLGAVDVIGKPGASSSFGTVGPELILKVKAAARARPRPSRRVFEPADDPRGRTGANPRISPPAPSDPRAVILLGASTGGVEALHEVLGSLPADMPGIAVVQHIPALFSKAFAERLNQVCAMEVREAADGDALAPARCSSRPATFTCSSYARQAATRCASWMVRPSGTSGPRSTFSSSPPPKRARGPIA